MEVPKHQNSEKRTKRTNRKAKTRTQKGKQEGREGEESIRALSRRIGWPGPSCRGGAPLWQWGSCMSCRRIATTSRTRPSTASGGSPFAFLSLWRRAILAHTLYIRICRLGCTGGGMLGWIESMTNVFSLELFWDAFRFFFFLKKKLFYVSRLLSIRFFVQ